MQNLFKFNFNGCGESTKQVILYIIRQYMDKGFVNITVNYNINAHEQGIYCLDNNGNNYQCVAIDSWIDDWVCREHIFSNIMKYCCFLKFDCNMEYPKVSQSITLTIKSNKD